MKVGDFVKISSGVLEILSKNDIKTEDYKYIELFKEYERLAADSKVSYAVAVLAEKYNISEASVYRILRRFRKTI